MSPGVVHAVAYSLLLLNTDLHVAELATRMSRGQFVRNTITAIQMQLQPSRYNSNADLTQDDWSSLRAAGSDVSEGGAPMVKKAKRSDSITSWNSVTREAVTSSSGLSSAARSSGQLSSASEATGQAAVNGSTVSVALSAGHEPKSQEPALASIVHDRNWEIEMENMLKVN